MGSEFCIRDRGYNALNANTTGTQNTALGDAAMTANTTGSNNTAIGKNALQIVTSGSQNTALGVGAGSANVQGTGNVFVGYMAGSQETGSNKLYIDNSSTTKPLISGDFEQDSVTINGDVKITGNLSADKVVSSTGAAVMHFEEATGAVHIGQNSMVFYDSEGPIGNGKDIMASSVGIIQIGNANTDVTKFVGEVHVPEPTKPITDGVFLISYQVVSSRSILTRTYPGNVFFSIFTFFPFLISTTSSVGITTS